MNQADLKTKIDAIAAKVDGVAAKIVKLKDAQGKADDSLVASVQSLSDKVDAVDASLPA